MPDATPATQTSPLTRPAVRVRLTFIALLAIVLAPAFAWLFQREVAAGIAGSAMVAAGTVYLELRKRFGSSFGAALSIALAIAAVVTTVVWLLRSVWGPWIGGT